MAEIMGSCVVLLPPDRAEGIIVSIKERGGTAERVSDSEARSYAHSKVISGTAVVRAWFPPGVAVHEVLGPSFKRVI